MTSKMMMQLMRSNNKWRNKNDFKRSSRSFQKKQLGGLQLLNHFNISVLLFQLGLVVFLTSVSVSSPTTFPSGTEMNGFSPGETIFKETTLNAVVSVKQEERYTSAEPTSSVNSKSYYYFPSSVITSSPFDSSAVFGSKSAINGQFAPSTTNHITRTTSTTTLAPSPTRYGISRPPMLVSNLSSSNLTPKVLHSLQGDESVRNLSSLTNVHNDLTYLNSLSSTFTSSASPFQSTSSTSSPATGERAGNSNSNNNNNNDNINLHRKLQVWSASGRSAKLNLTHEHESLLRIEPKPRNSTRRFTSLGEISEFLSSSTSTLSSLNSFVSSTSSPSLTSRTTTTFPTTTSLSPTSQPTISKLKLEPAFITQRSRTTKDDDDDQLHIPSLYSNPIKSRPGGTGEDEGEEFSPLAPSRNHLLHQYLYPPDWLARHSRRREDITNTNGTIDYYTDPADSYDPASDDNSKRQDSFFMPHFDSGSRRRTFGNGRDEEEDSPERERSGHDDDDVQISQYSENSSRTQINENSFPSIGSNDNGLADVISRGRIDSVMYVYFGDKYNDDHKEEVAGRVIQAVGGVIAAIAQILTVLGATKCIRKGNLSNRLPIHIHVGFALLISNLLLLLAVHATEPLDVCASVAVILHYLHLVIGCWFLAQTIQTYRTLGRYIDTPNNLLSPDLDQISNSTSTPEQQQQYHHSSYFGQRTISSTTFRYCTITWAAPFPFILITYLTSPEGYETHRFCWMSIERGMVVSFIVPIFLLIGLNTVLVILSLRYVLALRKLWLDPNYGELEEDLSDGRTISSSVIRASAVLLPLLAVMWFLGVVALENPTSIFFQLAAAVANISLSWLVMYFIGDEVWFERWCSFFNNSNSNLSTSIEEGDEQGRSHGSLPSIQPAGAIQLSFDNEPLLTSTTSASSSRNIVAGPSTSNNNYYAPSTSTSASSSSATPGPSNSSSKCPSILGRRSFYKNKPNWSRPGGNEIYELRHDAISTICK